MRVYGEHNQAFELKSLLHSNGESSFFSVGAVCVFFFTISFSA